MKRVALFAALTALFQFSPPAFSADFFPQSAAEFQMDLLTAAGSDGVDDTIHLSEFIYRTADIQNQDFLYSTASTGSLTILGAGIGKTFLDGTGGVVGVLNILIAGSASNVNIQGVTFQNGNRAGDGGALMINNLDGETRVEDCEFINNRAVDRGGAVRIQSQPSGQSTGNIFFTNNIVTGNSADLGADTAGGVDLESQDVGDVNVQNNLFQGNRANQVGGTRITSAGFIVVEGNTFLDNEALNGAAGGVFINNRNGGGSGSTTFTNNVLSGNVATSTGGGASIHVESQISAINVINNSFSGNSANEGGAFYTTGTSGVLALNIYNNVAFGNQIPAGPTLGADFLVDDDLVNFIPEVFLFNNDISDFCRTTGGCAFTTADNQADNINQDPLFVNATTGDLRVRVGSPVADKGFASAPQLPSEDIAGNPRNTGAAPDMGAFEAAPVLALVPVPVDIGTADLGQTKSQVITLNNAGLGVLNIASLTLSDTTHFSLNLNGGPTPCADATPAINSGQACTVALDFSSTTAGSFPATLTVASNDFRSPSFDLPITAQANQGGGGGGGGCALGAGSSSFAWGWIMPLFGYFLIRKRRRG